MNATVPADPLVSLVVVNFNGAACIRTCAESLLAGDAPARELIIVDNASCDGSRDVIEALARAESRVRVLWSDRNRGYAGAINWALPHCRGRFVAVLNMDLIAEPGWLPPLVDLLESRPEAGAVSPVLILGDGLHVNAAGQRLHWTGLGFNAELGRDRTQLGSEPTRVSGIHGAAFLMRRALLRKIGGLDETGFLYHEDVNLSWLLRMMGFELYCAPASALRHDYFLSMYPQKLHLLERNRVAMLLAYLAAPTLLVLGLPLLVTECLIWFYALLRGPRFLMAKLRSLIWLWRMREPIRARRRLAAGLRERSDREVLRGLHTGYVWRQFLVLARERGPSARRPDARPPADV